MAGGCGVFYVLSVAKNDVRMTTTLQILFFATKNLQKKKKSPFDGNSWHKHYFL